MQCIHLLAGPRFARRLIPNYTVLRSFRRLLMYTWNMDRLAKYTCGDWHCVIEAHGGVPREYGSAAGADLARMTQEYGLEEVSEDLHLIGPERLNDPALQRKLRAMQQCTPAFVLIVGYSFGLFEGCCDDQLALATFASRFRDVPIDVYICDPRPRDHKEMLREELRSDRVHALPVYWNMMAWVFTQVMAGKMDVAHLDYFHERTLDTRGPGFLPEMN